MFGADFCNFIAVADAGFLEIRNKKKPKSKIEFENLILTEMPQDIKEKFLNILNTN